MFRKIIGTIGTRAISAILTLIIWIMVARFLGAANLGTIALIIFDVAIIQLFTSFFGGSSIIYMTPRAGVYRLLIPAYIWSILVAFASSGLLLLLNTIWNSIEIIPSGYFWEILFLGIVMSLVSVNSMLFLGQENVKVFNIISLIQIVLLFLFLIVSLFILNTRNVMTYYWSILVSFILVLVISTAQLLPSIRRVPLTGMKKLIGETLRFGTYVQFANIFQQLNYRLSYYIVDFFLGRMILGVFTIGVQLSEGLWLISRSIGMVQLTRISNEMDTHYAIRISLTLVKVSWIITLLVLFLLLLIPVSFFQLVFGGEFTDVKLVIIALGTGIVTLSISIILSQLFSGINKPFHNTISSAIGLVFTLCFGFILIPRWGLVGAGITSSISYTVATIYQLIIFSRMTKLKARDLLLKRYEIILLTGELKKVLFNSGKI